MANAPRIVVTLHASKMTTRDGSHRDDDQYLEEIKADLEVKMKQFGFHKSEVDVRIEE